MKQGLFPQQKPLNYLLDLEYKGPSFEGVMEISALKNQIAGIEDSVKIAARVLAKHKKLGFNPNDLEMLVEAFEKGSFKDRVKVVLKSMKGLDDFQGAINLGILIVAIIAIIQQKQAPSITEMSPELISEIGDQAKIELLKDPNFLKSIANIVRPLEDGADQLYCSTADNHSVTVNYSDKKDFLELAGDEVKEVIDDEMFETLRGRINRVDLDATVRHIGFKVDSEGVSISATLAENLRRPEEMKSLLGQWVDIEGSVSYSNGIRKHISITKYKTIQQPKMNLDNQ